MMIAEFIECPNVECDCKARYDPDDGTYECNACKIELKPIRIANMEDAGEKFEIGTQEEK